MTILTLTPNACGTDFPCCLCGDLFTVGVPLAITAVGYPDYADVCPNCAEHIDPGILDVTSRFNDCG